MSTKVRLKDLLREKDAFLTTSERIYNFYLTHTTKVLTAGLVAVLAVVGVAAGMAISSSRAERASHEYYLALDPGDPAGNLAAMTAVRERWGDGRAGRLAAFSMAGSYMDLGRFDEARALVDELASGLKGPERGMAPAIYRLQGALAEETGDLAAAASHYERAWELAIAPPKGPDGRPLDELTLQQTAVSTFRTELLSARARVYRAMGRAEDARRAYGEIEQLYPGTPRALMAGWMIGEMDSGAAEGAQATPAAPPAAADGDGIVTEDLPAPGAPAAPAAGPEGEAAPAADGAAPAEGEATPSADAEATPAADAEATPAADSDASDEAAPAAAADADAEADADASDARPAD
jgi:tetratricopeptide (TPR) repeat protein